METLGGFITLLDAAMFVWESELGQPYRWAGDDPISGFDCSGFAQEGLRSVGILPYSHDFSADALLTEAFKDRVRITVPSRLYRGMLAFWPRPDGSIRHVEVVWNTIQGTVLTIGASGGNSSTISKEVAVKQNAYVKIHPIPAGWISAVDPFGG